jgi:hypothetical protein
MARGGGKIKRKDEPPPVPTPFPTFSYTHLNIQPFPVQKIDCWLKGCEVDPPYLASKSVNTQTRFFISHLYRLDFCTPTHSFDGI